MTEPTDTLAAALADAISRREQADVAIAAIEKQLAVLRDVRRSAITEQNVLQSIRARQSAGSDSPELDLDLPAPKTAEPMEFEDWGDLSRADAVLAAIRKLVAIQASASPGEIEAVLHAHHRDDTRVAIGAAIAYLHRTDQVKSFGRAQWVPAVKTEVEAS